MSVSVVLAVEQPTRSVGALLSALRYQTHPVFEVILVTGPYEANVPFADHVKIVTLAQWTTARAKNVGAVHAAGEIVVFLDSDAFPDTLWLRELLRAYDDERIAAVGGPVANADDEPCYTADRLGNRLDAVPPPYWAYQIPYGDRYVCLHAGNASFRRTTFLAVGGFDEGLGEELHQTDLCLRLTDRGYLLQPSSRCIVYKIAESEPLTSRERERPEQARRLTSVAHAPGSPVIGLRNKVRFGVRSANPLTPRDDVLLQFRLDTDDQDRAVWEGIALAVQDRPAEPLSASASAFRNFPCLKPVGCKLTLGFTTSQFPPTPANPHGRHTWNLARSLADHGHDIHLFAVGNSTERTDFEQGVWVHRPTDGSALHRAVTQLGHTRPIDLFVVNDCEGLYCLHDPALLCVVQLQPTLKMCLEDCPGATGLPDRDEILYREQLLLQSARNVVVSGSSMLERVRRHHGMPFAPVGVHHCPPAVRDRQEDFSPRPSSTVRLLFVGALGPEHGVDLFLRSVVTFVREGRDFEAILTGDADTPSEAGPSYRVLLEREAARLPELRRRLRFAGELSEDGYGQVLADCDVVCLPYRTDTLAVPCIEGQMFGKAVVASDRAREILPHGLLFPHGDTATLTACLRDLLLDAGLRQQLGRQGRDAYETHFAFDRTLATTLAAYTQIIAVAAGLEVTAR